MLKNKLAFTKTDKNDRRRGQSAGLYVSLVYVIVLTVTLVIAPVD